MASSTASIPSERVERRRLSELLEQPQEPFLLEVYLLENRCSSRIKRSQVSPFCWPLNAIRSRAAGFLRSVLVKLVYGKAIRKALHWDRRSFFSEDSEDWLSPVCVLDLQHSDESSSPLDNQKSSQESSITLKETDEKFSNRRRLLFDSEMFEETMNELMMASSGFSSFREEWNQFKPGVSEIGLRLESAIFDDLKEDAVSDMLVL